MHIILKFKKILIKYFSTKNEKKNIRRKKNVGGKSPVEWPIKHFCRLYEYIKFFNFCIKNIETDSPDTWHR